MKGELGMWGEEYKSGESFVSGGGESRLLSNGRTVKVVGAHQSPCC